MNTMLVDRQAVFFDFDGVLVDSMNVKCNAFAALYVDDYPHLVDAVIAYHRKHGGVSRYKKFDYYERQLVGRVPTQARIDALAERFEGLVFEGVCRAPEIRGAGELLKALKTQSVPCYVVSGTPETELLRIVERRGLAPYFGEVRGSPEHKIEILGDLLTKHSHDPRRCVMLGDALGDLEAAHAVGMPFLGVVCDGASPFGAAVPTASSLDMSTNSVEANV